ncbi:MAG: hypothetical protein OXU34_04225 [Gammaproteobacteria bacterium]|nr:hypothetical protein [Gammaproteobacteria bacterium]
MNLKTQGSIQLTPVNELVAVLIGADMTDKSVPMEDKAALKELMDRFEKVNVAYPQNTANEMNIVVPQFPDFDKALDEMHLSEEELEQVVGGEGVIAIILLGLGAIGAGVAGIFGATVGGTAAVAIGVTVIAVSALAVAGAVTGVGVGIAAGVGAFSDNDVNISHAS